MGEGDETHLWAMGVHLGGWNSIIHIPVEIQILDERFERVLRC
jgi:hypothetical protein